MKNCFYIAFLFFCSVGLLAQESSVNESYENRYKQAMQYRDAFNNDSTNIILSDLMNDLIADGQLDSPFGLKVQLKRAESLERDEQDEKAISELLFIAEMSAKKQVWDVQAEALISLARLHEKIGNKEQCLEYLTSAKMLIQNHHLTALYPRFALRYSSYHRIFDNRDSAVHYAHETVLYAGKQGDYLDVAVGYLLLGLMDENYLAKVNYFDLAGKAFKTSDDNSGLAAILHNLSKLHLKNNQLNAAMIFNDSSLVVSQKSFAQGNELLWQKYKNYEIRAQIFRLQANHDSAWHYLNKSRKLEIEDLNKFNTDKVLAIEAKYDSQKKEQQIIAQRRELASEKLKRQLFYLIFAMTLIFSGFVIYNNRKLTTSNAIIETQTLHIKKTNDELSNALDQQMLLQGELHHRVKNNLQVIISLLKIQETSATSPDSLQTLKTVSNRIYSIVAIHELLYQKNEIMNIHFDEYVHNICTHFGNFLPVPQRPHFAINVKDFQFNVDTTMPLGIILTELITNSIKYALSPDKQLTISIDLKKKNDQQFELTYADNGPGFPGGALEQRKGGLGARLLQSLSRQLKGNVKTSNQNGAMVYIFFEIKNPED